MNFFLVIEHRSLLLEGSAYQPTPRGRPQGSATLPTARLILSKFSASIALPKVLKSFDRDDYSSLFSHLPNASERQAARFRVWRSHSKHDTEFEISLLKSREVSSNKTASEHG